MKLHAIKTMHLSKLGNMSALSVWFARDWGASWGMGNSLSKLGSQGAVGCPKCPMSGGFRSNLHAEGSQVPREYRFRGRSLAGNPRPQSRDGFFNDSHQNAPEALLMSVRGSRDGFPLMTLVALLISITDDRNGLFFFFF